LPDFNSLKRVLSYNIMFEDFKPPNNDQRRYLSSLFGLASVAWATPIYNLVISLHLHSIKFSIEYLMFILSSLLALLVTLILGFSVLRAIK